MSGDPCDHRSEQAKQGVRSAGDGWVALACGVTSSLVIVLAAMRLLDDCIFEACAVGLVLSITAVVYGITSVFRACSGVVVAAGLLGMAIGVVAAFFHFVGLCFETHLN